MQQYREMIHEVSGVDREVAMMSMRWMVEVRPRKRKGES